MIDFLKLIRLPNLLIVALTQYLMRWCIIHPMLKINGFTLQFSSFNFLLLVLSSVFITAAGYVINDYFDTKTDLLNRPGKVIVGKHIKRRTAMVLHFLFNFSGIALGVYISFMIKLPALSLVFILIAGILWFYSTTYKRQFLIGNLIVAILTAFVPLMVILFELPLLNREYGLILLKNNTNFNYMAGWIVAFSFFAFTTTLIREIIKDIEDLEGDSAYGRNTLPIIMGIKPTKLIVLALVLVNIFVLIFLYMNFFITDVEGIIKVDLITLIYFSIALIFPFILLIIRLLQAKIQSHYHFVANLSKIIMLTGILYALIANYIILEQL